MEILDHIKDKLSTFKNLYDIIRIIDPINQRIIVLEQELDKISESNCFDFWSKNERCSNCVSLRAQNEDDTFVKLELKDDRVYILIASPVTIDDKRYVVEMLKDISRSDILRLEGNSNQTEKLISELNKRAAGEGINNISNRIS